MIWATSSGWGFVPTAKVAPSAMKYTNGRSRQWGAHCMRCNHRSLATKSRCRIAAPEAQDHVNVGLQLEKTGCMAAALEPLPDWHMPLRCLTRATGARRLARHVEHRPGKPRERELIPIAWRWEVPQWSTPVVGIIRWLAYIPSRLIIGMSAVTKIRTRDMAASAALRALSAYVTHFLHGVCLFNGRTKTRKSR